jgi:exopolyphosphatase/guanosine-5'-triphosphate,3'-diphosphate pyrophosphatase
MSEPPEPSNGSASRVGAIDIGTNSVLLLIAERRGGELLPLVERATITRLGQGVDRTRELAPEALERTLDCLAGYAGELRAWGVGRARAVGTSAMRDARGGAGFRERAAALLGFEPEVISGDEEARLSFVGGLSGLPIPAGEVAVVFDIGGGSTEIVRGRRGELELEAAKSLDIGSVRLTERHVRHDPPTPEELEAIDADVADAMASAPRIDGARLVGVAGTVTTLAAIAEAIDPYDAGRVHGLQLRLEQLEKVAKQLASLPLAERTKLPGLSPKRADVIVAGARIALAVARAAGASSLLVSDRGVRWGVAEALARAL